MEYTYALAQPYAPTLPARQTVAAGRGCGCRGSGSRALTDPPHGGGSGMGPQHPLGPGAFHSGHGLHPPGPFHPGAGPFHPGPGPFPPGPGPFPPGPGPFPPGPGPFPPGPGPFPPGPGPFPPGPGPFPPGPGPFPPGPGPFPPGPGPFPPGPGPFPPGPGPFPPGPGPFPPGPGPFPVPFPVPIPLPFPPGPFPQSSVTVIINGGVAFPGITQAYQIPYRPGLPIAQALAATGVVGFGPRGQVVSVSGIPIGAGVNYQLQLNGRVISTSLLSFPVQPGDSLALVLFYAPL
jgi:hypothetical protein